jgi:ceramide glucosyltransferase
VSASKGKDTPRVTIIRPCKGIDVQLDSCLASTFQQTYPLTRLTVYFCVDSPTDPALPILKSLISRYPEFDAQIFIETEDPKLQGTNGEIGPNPKIRGMSRAYREAKSDIVWIIDCNVWVNKGTCGRMVDRLCGLDGSPPNKFVHQIPLVVDMSPPNWSWTIVQRVLGCYGGKFEEAWFAAAHSKFYTAINTVLIAPCIVGKSNMFRRSNLDGLTNGQGIDYFSYNICEDHLIGDLLWKRPVPPNVLLDADKIKPGSSKQKWGNHALNFGDLAIQPVANMSLVDFISRRVRWLRVRKFTVILATLVEPGTESILCSLYGAYAVSTLAYFYEEFGVPPTWVSFWLFWLFSMTIWASIDFVLYRFFESGLSIEVDDKTPLFAQFNRNSQFQRKSFKAWFPAWVGRELLAFPIWAWAVYGGFTVSWRGRKFRVSTNMRVREITTPQIPSNAGSDSKSRID